MKRTSCIFSFFLILISSSCSTRIIQLTPSYEPPGGTTKSLQLLETRNLLLIGELFVLTDIDIRSGIVELIQSPKQDELLAAYSDGYLRKWDLAARNITDEYNLEYISGEVTTFSADGSYILTPNDIVSGTLESADEMINLVDGENLWETNTGKKVGCFGFHCYSDRQKFDPVDIGATLRPNGEWVVEYSRSVVSFDDIRNQRYSLVQNLDNPDDDKLFHISKLTFDPRGDYYAIAYEEGHVELYSFADVLRTNFLSYKLQLGNPENIRVPVSDIVIDETRSWIALLRGKDLRIWNLSTVWRKPRFSYLIDDATTMTFDHSGTFLAIGGKNHLYIIDMVSGFLRMVSLLDNKVTSINISQDNRLLFWGDSKGIIHIWGVAQTPP